MNTFSSMPRQRGSALLIVLGFLSFMLISAVSFAIYMRIERQASSNFKHSIQGRHFLNAGLCRAIHDIDGDLGNVKFPKDWTGRIRASSSSTNDVEIAPVLSLEALSYLPAIWINNVRYYASTALEGAQWRNLATPDGFSVGRYAYVCVNLSDMLNVNVCKASFRDSGINRVSIGYLFNQAGTDAGTFDPRRKDFDETYQTTDHHYETMQDFYSCIYDRRETSSDDEDTISMPKVDTPFGSPYHSFLHAGSPDFGLFNKAEDHVLVTDGMAKPEPTKASAPCNVLFPKLTVPEAATTYATALKASLVSPPDDVEEQLKYYINDYLDDNDTPYSDGKALGSLFRPSTEMVPMVYEISRLTADLPNPDSIIEPEVISRIVPEDPANPGGPTKKDFYLKLAHNGQFSMVVKFLFPFKYLADRRANIPSGSQGTLTYDTFKTDVEAYLIASSDARDFDVAGLSDSRLRNLTETPVGASGRLVVKLQTPPPQNIPLPLATETDVNSCCIPVPIQFTVSGSLEFPLFDSKGVPLANSAFAENEEIRVALVVFVGVKDKDGSFVDQAPGYMGLAAPTPTTWSDSFGETYGRLFFQTDSQVLARNLATPRPINFQWSSLEVPDPRFNHKAQNWFSGNDTVGNKVLNPSTLQMLDPANRNGRDGDVYMYVSDHKEMASPGEFGFIVRPYPSATVPDKSTILKNQTVAAFNFGDTGYETYHMFRTIRLYSHGDNFPPDKVYEHFIATNPDGTLPGARVNPLSDLMPVRLAAMDSTPADYFWAWAGPTMLAKGDDSALTTVRNHTYNKILDSSWNDFCRGWTNRLENLLNTTDLNNNWNVSLSDEYGKATFGWYSGDQAKTIFSGAGIPQLSAELHEIDRKMLYSFSLDSFCTRQQLFLYFVRAEATVPFFGNKVGSGMQSMAGGRAVALVWRDPLADSMGLHQHRILYFKQLDN